GGHRARAAVRGPPGGAGTRPQDLDPPGSGARSPARSRGDAGLRRTEGGRARCPRANAGDVLSALFRDQPPRSGLKSLAPPLTRPLPRGERELSRQAPDAADGRLVGEGELGQGEIRREVLKDHADALADGDLALRLRLEVLRHEVANDAEGFVR